MRLAGAQPRFVFHTRRSLDAELNASFYHVKPNHVAVTRSQWQCFDAYCSKNQSSNHPCGLRGLPAVPVFRHTLEDELEDTENKSRLWRFLADDSVEVGCDN